MIFEDIAVPLYWYFHVLVSGVLGQSSERKTPKAELALETRIIVNHWKKNVPSPHIIIRYSWDFIWQKKYKMDERWRREGMELVRPRAFALLIFLQLDKNIELSFVIYYRRKQAYSGKIPRSCKLSTNWGTKTKIWTTKKHLTLNASNVDRRKSAEFQTPPDATFSLANYTNEGKGRSTSWFCKICK